MFFFYFFFEQSAIDIIEQALQDEETLDVGIIEKNYAFDYILPKGCKRLGLPPKTALYVKKELVPGIYSILFSDARKAIENKACDKFVVIFENAQKDHFGYKVPADLVNSLSFLSYEELKLWAETQKLKPKPKDWKEEREMRIVKLSNEIWYGQNTLFLGAGLSSSLGVPSWKSLLQSLLAKLRRKGINMPKYNEIKKESSQSYLIIARYIAELAKQNKKTLVSDIRSLLYKNIKKRSDFMDSIVDLMRLNRIGEIITYNYDTLLEYHMQEAELSNLSIDSQSRRVKNAIPVMHVHGIIEPFNSSQDSNVVLCEDEYHDLYRDSFHWANVSQLYALTHTTCIFAGLSMKDPSLRRLLDIANRQGTKDINHYAFLVRDDYCCHKETEAVFSQMGVNIIWCENYDDVPIQIGQVVRLSHRRLLKNPISMQ